MQKHRPHQELEELAYRLWEKAGRPHGQAQHFWEKARNILWHAQARIHEFRVEPEEPGHD